jgi:hypothetical protein
VQDTNDNGTGRMDLLITTGNEGYGFEEGALFAIKENVNSGPQGAGWVMGPFHHLPINRWVTIEAHVRWAGDDSGFVRYFMDGSLVEEQTGVQTLTNHSDKVVQFLLFTYWNSPDGSERPADDQSVDIEDITLADSFDPPPIRANGFPMIERAEAQYEPNRLLDFNNGTPGNSATSLFDEGANETYFSDDQPYKGSTHAVTYALSKVGQSGYNDNTFEFGGWLYTNRVLGEGDEAWCRVRTYWPDDAYSNANPWLKFLRWHTDDGYADLYIDNDGTFRWIKENVDNWYQFDDAYAITPNEWQTIEYYIYFHSDPDQGLVGLFVEGVYVGEYRAQTLSASDDPVNRLLFFTYWNNGSKNSPDSDHHVYFDDLAIAYTGNKPPVRSNGYRMIEPG